MTLTLWLLEQTLLLRAAYGDPHAWRRLRAITRLRTRWEIRDLRALCAAAREMGVNPAIIVRAWAGDRLAMLQGYAAEGLPRG